MGPAKCRPTGVSVTSVIKNFNLKPYNGEFPEFRVQVANLAARISDRFERADSSDIGSADTGQLWLEAGGVASITNRQGRPTTGTIAHIDTGDADGYIALSVHNRVAGLGAARIVARFTDVNNYLFFGEDVGDGFYKIQKKEAGLISTLQASATAAADGDELRLELNGSTITAKVNDVQVATTTSTLNQTETKHGFSANHDTPTVDDFAFGPLSQTSVFLSTILANIAGQVGLAPEEFDFSAAETQVPGFVLLEQQEAREAVTGALMVHQTDLIEADGKIKAVARGGAAITVPEGDLGARIVEGDTVEDPPPLSEAARANDFDLPFEVAVSGWDQLHQQLVAERTTQSEKRITKPHIPSTVTIETNLMHTEDQFRRMAARILYGLYTEREQFNLSLPLKYLWLTPADCLTIPVAGGTARVRVVTVDHSFWGPITANAVLDVLDVPDPGADRRGGARGAGRYARSHEHDAPRLERQRDLQTPTPTISGSISRRRAALPAIGRGRRSGSPKTAATRISRPARSRRGRSWARRRPRFRWGRRRGPGTR